MKAIATVVYVVCVVISYLALPIVGVGLLVASAWRAIIAWAELHSAFNGDKGKQEKARLGY